METETQNVVAPKASVFSTYIQRIKAFSPNARRYLASEAVYGISTGIFQLLFNFYVLSLGYNESVIGNMVAARSMTSLIIALPMGFLMDRIGRKNAIIYSIAGFSASVALMLLYPTTVMFIAMNIVQGVAQSLG
ncbi:MAG: MFS transporter [Chloroflexi bacterium]|nr:MFS transporter [Chloroflexota bacterium]